MEAEEMWKGKSMTRDKQPLIAHLLRASLFDNSNDGPAAAHFQKGLLVACGRWATLCAVCLCNDFSRSSTFVWFINFGHGQNG